MVRVSRRIFGTCIVKVFFYGLFMDVCLLATKGVVPSGMRAGFLDGHGLRIGERATLVPRTGSRAYGIVMEIATDEVEALYGESSVTDYVPEPVIVELMDGAQVRATCYNLPGDKVTGTNKEYAASLLEVATRLGFPDSYLDQIRRGAM